ncbi:MAG: FkbM family methyltransferase [Terriglobia bacterium]
MTGLANQAVRSLTTNGFLVSLARHLRLAAPLKSLEFRLRGPSDGVVHHKTGGVEVVFAASNATEFRTLESCYADEADFIDALAKKLRLGGVFYDVGSNVGQFLIPVAKMVGERGEVIGFEPHPANHEGLLKNIALNRLANVRVFQVALADSAGEIQIYGTRGTATVVARAAATHPSTEVAAVRAMRGDDLRAEAQLLVPKGVKIDVEGAEFGVLRGLKETLSSPLCELLCLEIHPSFLPPEVSTGMVLSLVRAFRFDRIQTRTRGSEIHLIAKKVREQA